MGVVGQPPAPAAAPPAREGCWLWHPFAAYALGVLVLLAGPLLPLGDAGAAAAAAAQPALLRRHGGAPGACGGGGGAGGGIALVVATTEARVLELAGRRVAPRRAGAHLYIAHGGGAAAALGAGSAATTCSALEEGVSIVRAGACGEAPSQPPWSGAHHPYSSLTCRAVEGLCAAVEASGAGSRPPPAFVALVSEDARFRWPRFLQRQRAAPAAAATFVLTEALEGWGWGLPPHLKKPFWPRMPGFNATLVLTFDVASTLCALHRAAPLQLTGPPELFFGFLLSTLDRVRWYSQPQPKAPAAAARCPAATFALGLDASAWAACAREAEGSDAAGEGGDDAAAAADALADLGVWPYPDPLLGELRHDAAGTAKAPPAAVSGARGRAASEENNRATSN
jgi:hypothetical protein